MVERTAPPIAAVESFRKSFRSNVLFMLLSSGLTRGSSTLDLGKNLQSVLVVDLLQHFVRQIDAVDSPAPLPVVARISVDILVIRLQEPVVDLVGIDIGSRSEERRVGKECRGRGGWHAMW